VLDLLKGNRDLLIEEYNITNELNSGELFGSDFIL